MAARNWTVSTAAFSEAAFTDPQLVEAWTATTRIAEALADPSEASAILSTAPRL